MDYDSDVTFNSTPTSMIVQTHAVFFLRSFRSILDPPRQAGDDGGGQASTYPHTSLWPQVIKKEMMEPEADSTDTVGIHFRANGMTQATAI